MTNYNKLRELSIKRILNNFKVVLKNNFKMSISILEEKMLEKELECVIGTIECDITNKVYSYEIKREINNSYLNKKKIKYKNTMITLSDYFNLYFDEAIDEENNFLNEEIQNSIK